MKKIILILLFFPIIGFGQSLTDEELKLYNLIMEYRSDNDLPAIPFSKSLTFVAQTHAKDLVENNPDIGNCNMHSWSNKGSWTSCCYTSDHAKGECMWDKPRELTSYKGDGYEIVCKATYFLDAIASLECWQSSSGHNDVILNQGIWKNKWQAIGIGIYKGSASVWFGKEIDL